MQDMTVGTVASRVGPVIAQLMYWLATRWMTGIPIPAGAKYFSPYHSFQTGQPSIQVGIAAGAWSWLHLNVVLR